MRSGGDFIFIFFMARPVKLVGFWFCKHHPLKSMYNSCSLAFTDRPFASFMWHSRMQVLVASVDPKP